MNYKTPMYLAVVVALILLLASAGLFVASFFLEKPQAKNRQTSASSEMVRIENAWVNGVIPGQMSTAGYFTLVNSSDKKLTLVGIDSEQASRIEMHETVMEQSADGDGMMRMQALSVVYIAAHSSLEFKPGASHLMVFGLEQRSESTQVELRFEFLNRPQLKVLVPLKSLK